MLMVLLYKKVVLILETIIKDQWLYFFLDLMIECISYPVRMIDQVMKQLIFKDLSNPTIKKTIRVIVQMVAASTIAFLHDPSSRVTKVTNFKRLYRNKAPVRRLSLLITAFLQ